MVVDSMILYAQGAQGPGLMVSHSSKKFEFTDKAKLVKVVYIFFKYSGQDFVASNA